MSSERYTVSSLNFEGFTIQPIGIIMQALNVQFRFRLLMVTSSLFKFFIQMSDTGIN